MGTQLTSDSCSSIAKNQTTELKMTEQPFLKKISSEILAKLLANNSTTSERITRRDQGRLI